MIVSIPKYHKKNLYGLGVGGFLKSLTSRFIRPNFINSIGKKLGKETLAVTKDTITDIVHKKKPIKKSLKSNLKKSKARLINETKEKILGKGDTGRQKKSSSKVGPKKKKGNLKETPEVDGELEKLRKKFLLLLRKKRDPFLMATIYDGKPTVLKKVCISHVTYHRKGWEWVIFSCMFFSTNGPLHFAFRIFFFSSFTPFLLHLLFILVLQQPREPLISLQL